MLPKGFKETTDIRKKAIEEHIPIIVNETLKSLVDALIQKKPKHVLEIGTAIGYSTIMILFNISDNTKIDTVEKDKEMYELAMKNIEKFDTQKQINCFNDDAYNFIQKLSDKRKYDFIFLDGPKSHYLKYIKALEKHMEKECIIFADDVLFLDYIGKDTQVLKKHRTIVNNLNKYLEYVRDNCQYDTKILKVGQGVAVSKKL